MDVVRGQTRVPQRREQRAHLAVGAELSGLYRCLACDRGGEVLVMCGGSGDTIAGERIETLAQTTLGIEARMRHRDATDDERVSAKSFDLEPQALQVLAIRLERITFGGAEMQSDGKKETLGRNATGFESRHELLIKNSLVSRVLVNQYQALIVLEGQVGAAELNQRWNLPGRD